MVDRRTSFPCVQLGVSCHINDNYFIIVQAADLGETDFKGCKFASAPPDQTRPPESPRDCKLVLVSPDRTCVWRDSKLLSVKNISSVVVKDAHIVQGQPQRKGVSPAIVRQSHAVNVSCVDQLCSVKHVPNVPNGTQNLPVGARLNQFWETWEALGAGPKVVQILKDGYTPPFQTRSNLTRSPTIIFCYVHPHRNLYMFEALHQLTNRNVLEFVKIEESLCFYNRLFLVQNQINGDLY